MSKLTMVAVCAFLMVAVSVMQGAEGKEEGWDTTVSAGVNMTSGNSETLNVNAGVAGEVTTEKNEVRLGLEGNYGESEVASGTNTISETTAQNLKAYFNYKRKAGRLYLYTDDSIIHDDIASIDYRAILGAGYGAFLLDSEKAKLGIELGVGYVWEELSTGVEATDDYLAIRFAARHDQTLSDTSKIWGSVEYLPRSDDFDDYLLTAEVGAEAALNTSLSLRLVLQDRYSSEPPVDIDENDISVIGSLVLKL